MTNQIQTKEHSKALTQYERLKSQLATPEIRKRFEEVLQGRSMQFMASILDVVYKDDRLMECSTNSIINSAMTAAVLDLPITTDLGYAWIIPYRIKGKMTARFQMGYRGFVQLALRTGQYLALNTAVIYEGQQVHEDQLTGKITLTGQKASDQPKGFAAYMQLIAGYTMDGTPIPGLEKFDYMTVEEVLEHAERYSSGFQRADSLWKTQFETMARKTILTRLLKRYGVVSIVPQRIIINAGKGDTPVDFTATGEMIDAAWDYDRDEIDAEYFNQEPPVDPADEVQEPNAVVFSPESLVDKGLAPSLPAAKTIFRLMPADEATSDEELIAWINLYNGYLDAGDKSAKAAEKANAEYKKPTE